MSEQKEKPIYSQRIEELRNAKDWSQQYIADQVGFTKSAVGGWERGEQKPNALAVAALARTFEVSADYLLGLVENPDERGEVPTLSPEAWEAAHLVESLDTPKRAWLLDVIKSMLGYPK